MNKDMDHNQDDKTVLVDRQGHGPSQTPLTDSATAPRIEQLEKRMIYAAKLPTAGSYNLSLNTLVAAACDLLSEVVQLKHGNPHENLDALKQHLNTRLDQFETQAVHNGAEHSQVKAANYILCTVLDEAIVTAGWQKAGEWSRMSLLTTLHNEAFGGERFFKLLDQLSKNPVKHLRMLELMYLCLALGFEGKYRIIDRGTLELEDIRDALYRQIRLLRGDVPRDLSPHWEGLQDTRPDLVRIVPWWMVTLFTVVCLVVMYSGFAWVLGEQRETVLQPYQQLDPVVVLPKP